jgi:hypothetical protein
MTINAAFEFIEHVKQTGKVLKCAEVALRKYKDTTYTFLPLNFSLTELVSFLTGINQEYDDGYGGQELYGTIWYTDGTWSTRGEYDGSEWWEHHEVPVVPDKLLRGSHE